jgi:uncharacterized damage-inducible protein DinB
VADRKPPRLADGEIDTLVALLSYQRGSLVRKAEGITAEQADWSPLPSGTSLLWLIRHMAEAEETWILRRFAGRRSGPTTEPGDRRPEGTSELDAAVARYQSVWRTVDAVVAESGDPEARCLGDDVEPPVTLRWVLAHLLEETARHAGHADILRELIDGGVGR